MRRRQFITLAGGAVIGRPFAARAQQRPHRLAFVHSAFSADQLTESGGPFWVRRFYQTLRELGDVEGINLVVERFSAEGRAERFASLAVEVVSRKPDVIVANLNELVRAFTTATSTIPIVGFTGDPVAGGLLTNLSHPGGNLTGVSVNAGTEIFGKRLQILKEAISKTTKVGVLTLGPEASVLAMSALREAARQLAIEVTTKEVLNPADSQLRRAYEEFASQHFDAAIVGESGSFLAQRSLLVELAAEHRLPVIYPYREYMDAGGLMAYAPDLGELAQRLASDVHQIFNGTKAGDIPFYQPNRFQFILSSKAARALGLQLAPALLAAADEVVE